MLTGPSLLANRLRFWCALSTISKICAEPESVSGYLGPRQNVLRVCFMSCLKEFMGIVIWIPKEVMDDGASLDVVLRRVYGLNADAIGIVRHLLDENYDRVLYVMVDPTDSVLLKFPALCNHVLYFGQSELDAGVRTFEVKQDVDATSAFVKNFPESELSHYFQETALHLWRHVSLLLLGKAHAGKTSLLRAMMGDDFVVDGESTVGAELFRFSCPFNYDASMTFELAKPLEENPIPWYVHENLVVDADISSFFDMESSRSGLVESDLLVPSLYKDGHVFGRTLDETSDVEDRKRFIFTVWDCGGQRVYYHTQQLFLREESLVLLVLDASDERLDVDDFRFWIQALSVGNICSKPVVVLTKVDECSEDHLQRRESELEGFLHTWAGKYPADVFLVLMKKFVAHFVFRVRLDVGFHCLEIICTRQLYGR